MDSWLETLCEGSLFGAAAGALLVLNGRIAGIGGITAQLFESRGDERAWRAWFIGGLLAGGAILGRLDPSAVLAQHWVAMPWLLVSGVLVGWGGRLGAGCTSGHGVCGVGRFSLRSIVAVLMFTATGMLVRGAVHLGGWS